MNQIFNQKTESKRYSYLNGKFVKVYLGRIPCKYKHIQYELNLEKKTNEFGSYQEILVKIRKTHFNGKSLHIFIDKIECHGIVNDFIIEQRNIDKLNLL